MIFSPETLDVHRRSFARASGGEEEMLGGRVEVDAVDASDRRIPIELSVTQVAREPARCSPSTCVTSLRASLSKNACGKAKRAFAPCQRDSTDDLGDRLGGFDHLVQPALVRLHRD